MKAAKALVRYLEGLQRMEEDYSMPPLTPQDASSMAGSRPSTSPPIKTESATLDPPNVGLKVTPTAPAVSHRVSENTTAEVKTEHYTVLHTPKPEYDDGMESIAEFMNRASPPVYFRTGLLMTGVRWGVRSAHLFYFSWTCVCWFTLFVVLCFATAFVVYAYSVFVYITSFCSK